MKLSRTKTVYLILGLSILVGFWVIFRQSDALSESLQTVRSANPTWLILGLLAVFATFAVASLTLLFIALKPLSYRRTLLIQFASGFATKLVPAGIGGIALNTRYLSKHRHTLVQAGSIMVLNNGLGFLGHITILLVVVSLGTTSYTEFNMQLPVWLTLILIVIALIFIALLLLWRPAKQKLTRILKEVKKIAKLYRSRPQRLLGGLLSASTVTLLFAACLWCSAMAMSIELSALEVLWVLSIGLIGIAVTPTPGGLGGAEAAMTAALIAIGISIDQALPVALIYRFLSYWIPIVPGIFAFQLALRKRYI